jgi:hypothetical protein
LHDFFPLWFQINNTGAARRRFSRNAGGVFQMHNLAWPIAGRGKQREVNAFD